jgi:hypothetical protein
MIEIARTVGAVQDVSCEKREETRFSGREAPFGGPEERQRLTWLTSSNPGLSI